MNLLVCSETNKMGGYMWRIYWARYVAAKADRDTAAIFVNRKRLAAIQALPNYFK